LSGLELSRRSVYPSRRSVHPVGSVVEPRIYISESGLIDRTAPRLSFWRRATNDDECHQHGEEENSLSFVFHIALKTAGAQTVCLAEVRRESPKPWTVNLFILEPC
jgi:hypothetical protein